MSDGTKQELDRAISEHIAEAFPGFYTEGWVVVAVSATLDSPRGKNYRILTPDTQPFHSDLGLLNVGLEILKDLWGEDPDEDEDDD